MKLERIVSAQVVLAATGGARPGPQTRITSENIHQWTPPAQAVTRIAETLRAAGFEVGTFVGNSMSITGPVRLFESCFRTKLREVAGSVEFSEGAELSAEKLPSELRADVVAVTFTRQPDFGPGTPSSFA